MRIVDLKCPNCGSNIEDINKDDEFFNCKKCGSTLYLEMTVKEKGNEAETSADYFRFYNDLLNECDKLSYDLRLKNITECEWHFYNEEELNHSYIAFHYPTGLDGKGCGSRDYDLKFWGIEINMNTIWKIDKCDLKHYFKFSDVELVKKYIYFVTYARDYAALLEDYVNMYKIDKKVKDGTYSMYELDQLPVNGLESLKNKMSDIQKKVSEYKVERNNKEQSYPAYAEDEIYDTESKKWVRL